MPRNGRTLYLNFWRAFELYPPIVVRLSARLPNGGKNVRAPGNAEIAILAGMPLRRVIAISESLTWKNVRLGGAQRFCEACRFDPTNRLDRNRINSYLDLCQRKYPNRAPMFLQKSPYWEREFLPLISRLNTWMQAHEGSQKSPSREAQSAA